MMFVWQERTGREKVLLAAAACVCACVLIYFAVVRPTVAYQKGAQVYLDSAVELHADVTRAAEELSRLSQNGAMPSSGDDRPVRVLASAGAREQGLSVTRIQPMSDQAVSFWVDEVTVAALFAWTIGLQVDHGITVSRADIQRMPDGRSVQAQIVLRKSQ